MTDSRALKAVLKRGALVTAANWPTVVVQFVAESAFKALLAVPIVGGALLVVLLVGADPQELLAGEIRSTLASIARALQDQPGALLAFLSAFAIVTLGGSAVVFLVKGGTVSILVAAEQAAGPIERQALRLAMLQRAGRFTIEGFLGGVSHLARRFLVLGFGLLAAYATCAGVYLAALYGWHVTTAQAPPFARTAGAAGLSAGLLAAVTVVNVCYLLTQMIVAADDRGVLPALRQVARFVRARAGDVAGVFGVMLALVVLATVVSILATAALGLIAFVPFVGLAVVPVQVGAWLLRGLIFQFLGFTTLGAYLTLYRAFLRGGNADVGRPGGAVEDDSIRHSRSA